MLATKDDLKVCSGCKENKPVSEYYKNRCAVDKLVSYCKTCISNYVKANRKKVNKMGRIRRRKNPWPQRARSLCNKAGLKFVTGEELKALYEQHNGLCYYCGHTLNPHKHSKKLAERLQFDHVIPGLHEARNLVPSCQVCNGRKRDNTIEGMERFIRQIERHQKVNNVKQLEDQEVMDGLLA